MRLIIGLLCFVSFSVLAQEEFDLIDLNVGAKGKYIFREFAKNSSTLTIIRIPNGQSFQMSHNLCRALMFDVELSSKTKGKYLIKKNSDVNVVYIAGDASAVECKNWEKYTNKYIQVESKIEDGVILGLIYFTESYDFSLDARFSYIKCSEIKVTAIKLDDIAFPPRVVNSINFRCGKSAFESKVAYDPISNRYVFLSIGELI